jgi:hypothetical protein
MGVIDISIYFTGKYSLSYLLYARDRFYPQIFAGTYFFDISNAKYVNGVRSGQQLVMQPKNIYISFHFKKYKYI